MMLVSLMRMHTPSLGFRSIRAFAAVYFSKTAIRHVGHQGEASRHQIRRLYATTIRTRRLTEPPREECAEASETGKTRVHANGGDGSLPRCEQLPGTIETYLRSILVWSYSEQRLELPDEVRRRDSNLTR